MAKNVGIILARGGSVRLPGKNVRPLGGIPLIAWTIRNALVARLDRLIVSTDSEEIASVARQEGAEVPFIRPATLATSEATSVDAVLHALDYVDEANTVTLLQPTSPFRRTSDIDAVLALVTGGAPAAVTVCAMPCKWNTFVSLSAENEVSHPAANPEPTHRLNGSVYTIWTGILRSQRTFVPPGCQAYEMPAYLSVDIDTYEDFTSAERALSSGQVAQLGELPKPC